MKHIKGIALITFLILVFSIGCKKDDNDPVLITPSVSSSSPASAATGVGLNNAISATFNIAMNPATFTSSTFTVKEGTNPVAGTISYSDHTATFTSTEALQAEKKFTVMVSTGVKSMAGAPLAANHTFNFTTGMAPDNTAPTISSTDPLSEAIEVARNKVISVTFSEEMDPATIDASTFTLMQGTNLIVGTVAYSGTTATFTPENILSAGIAYKANFSIDAKDLAGNALEASKEWNFTTGGSTSTLAVVDLGAAGNYVILSKTAINNSSTSAITGDLGLSPAATSYITGLALTDATGYATSSQVTGNVYAADMADPTPINLTTAVNNMLTAYNDAAGRPSPDFSELGTGNIGGGTLIPGLYKWSNTVTLPSDVTISGSADDVWIFQIAGDLTMSSAVKITLIGGAQAKNIFWQVAGEATLGTTSHFEGVLMSMTGITLQTGASFKGRALAQTAVILDSNAVTQPQ